jgi:protein TonB
MFDDFRPDTMNRQARKRFGGSMAAAVVIYGSSSAMLIGATATARHVVEEELTQVEFAPPPEPEPEPPPPEQKPPEVAAVRPKVKRPKLTPPKEVPLEKPKESDAPLAAAEEVGQEGSLDGVEGGTGTGRAAPPPPPPPPAKLVLPVPMGNFESTKPDYPKSAQRKGIEGLVVVAFEVTETGAVANPRIVSGPPEFHSSVLKMVMKWRYKPARRGATAIRYRLQKNIRFRLEDA